jgi:hypothetical protein
VSRRLAVALAAALAAVALAACGGDDESGSTTKSTPPVTAPPSTGTTETDEIKTPETPSTPPEDKPGGAGDETPARFDASLTGRGGRIAPTRVSVGPYISVRVLLRSADGQLYQLRVNGKTLSAKGNDTSQLTLPGLRPGRSYTLEPTAGGRAVKIVANAEPGP